MVYRSFITISEYAERKGISLDEAREEIAKDNGKAGYFKTSKGIEYVLNPLADTRTKETREEKQDNTSTDEIERLKAEIDALKKIVEEKDRQLSDYSTKYAALAEKALLLTEQAQQITAQAQVLHLQSQNKSEERKELAAGQPKERKASLFTRVFKHR